MVGQLALALGPFGRFARGLLVLLGFRGVDLGLLTVAPRAFAEAHALEFAPLLGFLRGHGDQREDRDRYDDDDGYHPDGHASSIPHQQSINQSYPGSRAMCSTGSPRKSARAR